jgi:hypothetical protein
MKRKDSADNCLTPDDEDEFWKSLREWQTKLSLNNWRITKSPIESKNLAEMAKWDWKQKQVTCRLGLNWKSSEITKESLEQTAVHELLHVLLHALIEISKENKSEDDVCAAEHDVINTLERLLVPDKQ